MAEKAWIIALPVSSDPIESLFSQYKLLQGRAPQGDPTRLIAILPLMAGENSAKSLSAWLRSCSHREATEWVTKHVPETIHSKKRKLNPGKEKKRVTKTCLTIVGRQRPYEQAIAA